MKKAGILIGLFFFVAAIVVFLLTNNAEESKKVDEVPTQQTQVVEQKQPEEKVEENKNDKQVEKDKEVEKEENKEPIQPVVQQPQVVEKVITKEVSSVMTISEGDLTTLLKEEEVIAMISNKRIMLIDENPSGNDKKTLTYCFDVLTPDNSSLVLFVTKSVYDAYKVQDRLKVAYKVYVNDKGVQFPIVSLVTSVTE